jgi:filamentous hemagglutinin
VEIAANGGRVDVAPGSVIDVAGGRSGGGEVVVRAPRQGNDVAIDRLGGDIRGAREVVVQGQKRYDASSIDSTLTNTMFGEASDWERGSASPVRDRLAAGNPALARLDVAPAMLVKSGGDLAVQADIDLSRVSGGAGAHGFLGLSAAGSIGVGAVVSDGFAGAALAAGRSFGIDLESGGDITLRKGAMIRTGSGDIALHAGKDIDLLDPTSVIYTAGRKTAPAQGFAGAPRDPVTGVAALIGEFPTDGGDIELRAGRDIRAPIAAQTTSAWLFRYGATSWKGDAASSPVTEQTSWSVVHGNFEQAVGALGGGDVRVSAGRDVFHLQVAIPTTGHLTTETKNASVATAGDLVVRGGGDLDLSAGRDVLGGLFVLGRGNADVRAGGGVLPSDTLARLRLTPGIASTLDARRKVGVLFGLMDATATVTAGSAVDVEGVFDPMMQGQVSQNRAWSASKPGTAFSGYTERTALEATSVSGTVTYENDPWASVDLSQSARTPAYYVTMSGGGDDKLNARFARAPGTLRLTSLESSVVLANVFTRSAGAGSAKGRLSLAPASLGTLDLLAGQDVRILLDVELRAEAPEYRRGPLQPIRYVPGSGGIEDQLVLGNSLAPQVTNDSRGFSPIHAGDPTPVHIYAREGSVCADTSGACLAGSPVALASNATMVFPKPIDVVAGRDVYVGDYQPQHNGPEAVTRIQAGRDVFDVGLEVTGEGAAQIRAGRNVVEQALVATSGAIPGPDAPWGGVILSKGNNSRDPARTNLALPANRAADVYITAGAAAGVDYDAFAAAYLDPGNGQAVMKTYLPELATYMKGLGVSGTTDAELVAAFKVLPSSRREIFLDGVYFTELKQTGIDYNDASSPRYHSFDRGFRAVSTLFPTDPSTLPANGAGSVILGGKSLESWGSGSITVLAPYGSVAVGSLFPPAKFKVAQGGVVTRKGGDVRIMADQNIDLFTARVFTLQGGDITMWTTNGSITAGSGSKTAVFNVPLGYVMSADGVVKVDAFGLQTGSGIGVLDAIQNAGERKKSRLDLIAPRGEVNAGDAGIRVIGDINLAALTVVGVENISVSGSAAGVPKVEAPNLGAMTTASQVSAAATKEGVGPEARPRTTAADLPSIITVEVVGYETTKGEGEEAPAPKKKRGSN